MKLEMKVLMTHSPWDNVEEISSKFPKTGKSKGEGKFTILSKSTSL